MVPVVTLALRLGMGSFLAALNWWDLEGGRGVLHWKLSREHVRCCENNGLRDVRICCWENGRACMMLLVCRVVWTTLRERRVGLFMTLKMRMLRLVGECVLMPLRFSMLGIIKSIISVRIRQRHRHTSALLGLRSPGRLFDLFMKSFEQDLTV